MKFAIAQKMGMTRVFDKEGKNIAVTMVKLFPMKVEQIKTQEVDGYSALKVKAYTEDGEKVKDIKSCEFDAIDGTKYKVDQKIKIEFDTEDFVTVTGTSKGKGFAGTIKRHGFKRGPEGHGGNNVREPGSIGAQQPQRVVLGRRMAGRLGGDTVTIGNLKVVDINKDTMLIAGAIPGHSKTLLRITAKSVKSETETSEE
jgi:large subunit ribosomal protein L3